MRNFKRLDLAANLVNNFRNIRGRDKSPAGWDVSRQRLSSQLLNLLDPSEIPDQGKTNNCGPAAFLYCVLQDRPDLYVNLATELWEKGHTNLKNGLKGHNFTLRPSDVTISELKKAREKGVTDLDWIMMGSLKSGDGKKYKADALLSGITFPGELRSWFSAIGAPAHKSKFEHFVGPSFEHFRYLLRSYKKDWIVLEIDPSILKDQGRGFF